MTAKGLFQRVDWRLLAPVLILMGLSFTTLFSIDGAFFRNQFIYFTIAIVAFFLFTQIDYRALKVYSFPIYVAGVILLLFVLLAGIESHGAVRWIEIFGFRIQFSEVFKPFLTLALAAFLASRPPSLRTLLTATGLLLPIVLLIFKQPNLGNALLYLLVAGFSFFVYGFPLLWFGIGAVAVIASMPLLWGLLHEYQKQRVLTLLYPSEDPLGTSYNATQSTIAVGSGGLLGKGLGEGTQSMLQFLPERHTDFIFAALAEQLGFLGALVLFGAFGFLLYRIYIIFKNSEDRFCKIFSMGAFFFISLQFFVNVGMNIGILPIVGITLPFISYGGSSLLANFIFLGLLSAMSKQSQKRELLEIR